MMKKQSLLKRMRWRLERARSGIQRDLSRRLKHPSGDSHPVFLVGAGRSGTSMIVRHLARSWAVDLFNEDDPLAFDYYRLKDFGTVEELVDRSRAPITLFKPIKDTYRTHALLSAFPTARILFVFRHYDDVVNSDRKKFYNAEGLISHPKHDLPADRRNPVIRWMDTDFEEFSASPPPEASKDYVRSRWTPELNLVSNIALHWLFHNRLYFDLGLVHDERVRLIRYESVVEAPESAFESICDFIGMDYQPEIARGVFSSSIQRDDPPAIDAAIRADCETLWQQLCRLAEPAAAVKPAGQEA